MNILSYNVKHRRFQSLLGGQKSIKQIVNHAVFHISFFPKSHWPRQKAADRGASAALVLCKKC